jgi:alpha-glucosidase
MDALTLTDCAHRNASDAYETFNRGNDTGSYMLNPDGSLYIGDVWPGYTVFPDWLTDAANEWWPNEMVIWHNKLAYDGAWIDMSEVSSFCVGSCGYVAFPSGMCSEIDR